MIYFAIAAASWSCYSIILECYPRKVRKLLASVTYSFSRAGGAVSCLATGALLQSGKEEKFAIALYGTLYIIVGILIFIVREEKNIKSNLIKAFI